MVASFRHGPQIPGSNDSGRASGHRIRSFESGSVSRPSPTRFSKMDGRVGVRGSLGNTGDKEVLVMKRQPTLGAAVTALAVLASACQDGPAEPFTPGRVASPSQRALVGAPDQAELVEAMYGFGGLYIDDDGVPTLNVTDLGEVGGADGVVRDFLGRRGIRTQRLRMRQVEFTLPELDEWFVATSPILEESGAVFIDLDERANRVVIGVEDASMLHGLGSSPGTWAFPRGRCRSS